MSETCKTCRFWHKTKYKEIIVKDWGGWMGTVPTLEYQEFERDSCVRFPKHEETKADHYCGEHKPILVEPQNVTSTGDIRYA